MNCEPVMRPSTKPEHAAVRSKATALVAPISEATAHAEPNKSSGEEVDSRTMSTSAAETPAISRARLAEAAACWVSDSPGARTCRRLLVVLVGEGESRRKRERERGRDRGRG